VLRRLTLSAAAVSATVVALTSTLTGASTVASAATTTSVRVVGSTGATPTATLRLVNGSYFRTAAAVTTPPVVNARAWAVADMDTGRVIVAHGRHDELPQASTIKLLTAVVAAETVAASPTHKVTYAEAHPQYCTCAGLVVGGRYTREALMAGMLLPSGNDAAEALAGSHPQGRAAFIAAMNAKVKALGAKHTVVVTPNGLTATGAHSSAYDLLVFLRAAQANPVVARVLRMASYQLGPVGGTTHTVYRRTDYVNKYPTAQGKSGYTTPAKNTLVVNTPISGHHIGVATLGAPSGYSTSGARALTLWAAKNFAALHAVGGLPAVPATPAG
jgi:serine-type D-Ala-D-Ala carboxypeptidase (penicillin-binding protein 5/6)